MSAMNQGFISQIIGPVVDVTFPDDLPRILDALYLDLGKDQRLILEVKQHLGAQEVRCIALGATDGLKRGTAVVSTGEPILVPVGKETLGRIFNVVGEPIDNLGPVKAKQYAPIHKAPTKF